MPSWLCSRCSRPNARRVTYRPELTCPALRFLFFHAGNTTSRPHHRKIRLCHFYAQLLYVVDMFQRQGQLSSVVPHPIHGHSGNILLACWYPKGTAGTVVSQFEYQTWNGQSEDSDWTCDESALSARRQAIL